MKKIIASGLCILFLISQSNAQITQVNWLLGGNGSYTREKRTSDFGDMQKYRTIDIRGNAGYFFIDKLAIGLRPEILLSKAEIRFGDIRSQHYAIGPFVRYYFLPLEKMVNLFADAGYSYEHIKVTGQPPLGTSVYSVAVGPAIFLNSAVALELLVGYRQFNANNDYHTKQKNVEVRLGLQFHLQKN